MNYKCPDNWFQNNNFMPKNKGFNLPSDKDPNNGVCINLNHYSDITNSTTEVSERNNEMLRTVDTFVYNQATGSYDFNYGETNSQHRFAYGPFFNQYPNNSNIPDQGTIPPIVAKIKSPAPSDWFHPNPPPVNWSTSAYNSSTEKNLKQDKTIYRCPPGWKQAYSQSIGSQDRKSVV